MLYSLHNTERRNNMTIEFKKKTILTENVVFRCHPHEKELFKEVADHLEISLSDYFRTVLLHDATERIKTFNSTSEEV